MLPPLARFLDRAFEAFGAVIRLPSTSHEERAPVAYRALTTTTRPPKCANDSRGCHSTTSIATMPDDAKRVDSRDDLLATISPKLISPGAEPKPRIGIDIESLAKAERNAENTEEDDIMKRLDAPVLVVFELPDGSEGEKTFKLGQTVEVLKAFVEDEFEIDMSSSRLIFG